MGRSVQVLDGAFVALPNGRTYLGVDDATVVLLNDYEWTQIGEGVVDSGVLIDLGDADAPSDPGAMQGIQGIPGEQGEPGIPGSGGGNGDLPQGGKWVAAADVPWGIGAWVNPAADDFSKGWIGIQAGLEGNDYVEFTLGFGANSYIDFYTSVGNFVMQMHDDGGADISLSVSDTYTRLVMIAAPDQVGNMLTLLDDLAAPLFAFNVNGDLAFGLGGPTLKSPDDTVYRIVVANGGALSAVAA